MKRSGENILSIVTIVGYLIMIGVNALANILPINDITTGEVSDLYGNLFAPAGITFSIWGVIYILLGAYCVFQFNYIRKKDLKWRLINRINLLFLFTSILNSIWIILWHYGLIGLSLMLMILLLVSLILIRLSLEKFPLEKSNYLLINLPFSVYFGWISVATIANVTAFLVKSDWNRFGLSETVWTVLIILVGLLIGSLTIAWFKDKAYGIVFVWAYLGIVIKHVSESGFDFQYPFVVFSSIFSIIVFLYFIFFKTNKGISF